MLVIENLHKWPPLAWLLCKLGRHDYEFVREGDGGYWLECFYCGRRKLTSGGRRGGRA